MKGRGFLSWGLCAVLVLTMVIVSGCGDKGEPAAAGDAAEWNQMVSTAEALADMRKNIEESEKAEYFVKKLVLLQEMEDFFDQKTPYPIFLINAACLEAAGETEKEALEYAEFSVIREQAVLWYAKENEVEISDERFNKWIIDYNALEDQELYQSACKDAGVSFEVFNRYIQRQYYILCIMDIANKADEKINETAITEEYKKSDDYKKLDKLLKNCEDLVKSRERDDLNKILTADIWY